jgi:hypothetical protein
MSESDISRHRRKALRIYEKQLFKCVLSTEMYQLKASALANEHTIQGFKASQEGEVFYNKQPVYYKKKSLPVASGHI